MKTPKEEAKELVDMFIPFQSDDYPNSDENYNAKKCALICVDWHLKEFIDTYGDDLIDNIEYWEEVKREIEKK